MKIPFSILFIFLFSLSQAQSIFAPVGSSFNYYGDDGFVESLNYLGDTSIAGLTIKKIEQTWYNAPMGPDPPTWGNAMWYMYEKNDSIFQFSPYDTTFQLMYSFAQPIGDSMHINSTISTVLDSIDTVFVCGTNRRQLYYRKVYYHQDSACIDTVRIIEGIGPVNDYLFFQQQLRCDAGDFLDFSCANIVDCVYPTSTSSCNSILGISSINIKTKNISLYPNPFQREVVIENKNTAAQIQKIEIINSLGIVIKKIQPIQEYLIKTDNLVAGIYFFRIYFSNETTEVISLIKE